MQYEKIIHQLLAFPGRGVQTFEAFQKLDRRLEFPHRSFRSIHVGGTNGKGSVAAKIAAALKEEGFRVGLYTSPHISSVRERIRINGELISEEAIAKHLLALFDQIEEPLSFFDLLTAAAFLYFQEMKVDFAVIEVGLGGRLDPTNVIHPILSLITSISYDHTELLGDTLEEIAQEKGGIWKKGVPCIVGPSASPFFPLAESVDCIANFYDIENCAIAQAGLQRLGVSAPSIEKGMRIRPICRFEQIGDAILDAAHNPDGFRRLAEALCLHFPGERFHFIVAFSQGKQWSACLDLIRPIAGQISFINSHPRFVPLGSDTMKGALSASQFRKVICGSFYHLAEARRCLGIIEPLDPK